MAESSESHDAHVEQIVSFVDGGDVPQTALTDPVAVPSRLKVAGKEIRTHTIIDFLQRPYLISHFKWLTTQAPLTQILSLSFPNVLFALPQVRRKITGFTFFSASVVAKIIVNAQPFQQGRLLIVFRPYVDQLAFAPSSAATLTGLTGYPHMELDLSVNQVATFKVPFIAPVSHLNLIQEQWSIGKIEIYVYSSLAGDEPNIDGAFWAHFEDIDLEVPTGVEPYAPPAMGTMVTSPPKMIAAMQMMTDSIANPNTAEWMANSSAERVSDIQKKAKKNVETFGGPTQTPDLAAESKQSPGLLTKISGAVGDVALAASAIPYLTEVALPIGLIAKGISFVAGLFGWSKPYSEKLSEPIQISTARFFANYNGVDLSKQLALESLNAVSVLALFGSGIDEESIKYVCSTPNYWERFSFSLTNVAGDTLYSTPINPIGKMIPYKTGFPYTYVMTHLAYMSQAFLYWRGNIKFIFKFIKTRYHAGRLRIIFAPQAVKEDGTTFAIDPNLCYSQIVDLQEVTDYTFEVPFIYQALWCRTVNEDSTVTTLPATGLLVVQVLNELRRPNEIVSDTVDIIVEKCAGENFQLAWPERTHGIPVVYDSGPPKPALDARATQTTLPRQVAKLQMFVVPRADHQLSSDNSAPLFPKMSEEALNPDLDTIGERVLSIRQLLHRNMIAGDPMPNPALLTVNPYACSTLKKSDSAVPVSGDSDYFTYFSSLYAFQRGGMRFKCFRESINQSGIDACHLVGRRNQCYPEVFATVATSEAAQEFPTQVNIPIRDGVFEIQVPYYGQYLMHPTAINPLMDALRPYAASTYVHLSLHTAAGEQNPAILFRSTADDFSLGFLIGAPLIQYRRT